MGHVAAQVIPQAAHVEVEQAIAVEIEDGRRPAHETLPAEPRALGHVLEAQVAPPPVEAVSVVHVGDQDVLEAVVVEVGDDRLARLPERAVGPPRLNPHPFGRVLETPATVVEEKRVAGASHQEQVHVAVAVDVLGRRPPSRERRRRLDHLESQLPQPARGTVLEVDPG